MTLKRRVLSMLDGPGGRHMLKALGTAKARQIAGSDVEIGFDQGWFHRVGLYRIPDGNRFDYYESTFRNWPSEIDTYFADVEDLWYRSYRPRLGDVIVDVGAGRGEDILPFSTAVGPMGRIYAIEANSSSFDRLSRLCRLNGLTNVTPIHTALMDQSGLVKIGDDQAWEGNTIGCGTTSIMATTLDELCARHSITRIDFLKMNIEGAEQHALLGMLKAIDMVSEVCICAHDFRAERGHGESYRTRNFVESFLRDHGFTVWRRVDDERDYVRDHVFGSRLGREAKL